jgi:hypothetical protein
MNSYTVTARVNANSLIEAVNLMSIARRAGYIDELVSVQDVPGEEDNDD